MTEDAKYIDVYFIPGKVAKRFIYKSPGVVGTIQKRLSSGRLERWSERTDKIRNKLRGTTMIMSSQGDVFHAVTFVGDQELEHPIRGMGPLKITKPTVQGRVLFNVSRLRGGYYKGSLRTEDPQEAMSEYCDLLGYKIVEPA